LSVIPFVASSSFTMGFPAGKHRARKRVRPLASSTWVNAFIKAPQQARRRNSKGFADPQQGCESDGPSGFNLLPVSRGEAERNHVFLAETLGFPKRADTLA
jgi:hypothetical protein